MSFISNFLLIPISYCQCMEMAQILANARALMGQHTTYRGIKQIILRAYLFLLRLKKLVIMSSWQVIYFQTRTIYIYMYDLTIFYAFPSYAFHSCTPLVEMQWQYSKIEGQSFFARGSCPPLFPCSSAPYWDFQEYHEFNFLLWNVLFTNKNKMAQWIHLYY